MINDSESLELLLMYGAQTETRDRSGMTPLMRAARHSHGMEQVLILLNYGADVNAMTDHRNDYRTVLHYAVLSGNLSLVNLLLKQGAKVDRMPPDGQADKPSPLHLAILRGDPALVRVLIEAGANVNRCSPIIGSPLHVACADNVPHRFEIMKVYFNALSSISYNSSFRLIFTLNRCFFRMVPIPISAYLATTATHTFVQPWPIYCRAV